MTQERARKASETAQLVAFMTDFRDKGTFAKMVCFFSVPKRYCHPREIMEFWLSLTGQEQDYYRRAVAELRL
ncbi:hypothetical protein SEA_LIBERTYBELL_70 [Streptomyces phage LibertyBell]|nr:hypothetical protein SEA_LIBERTYBELL_70 [Streptomyces phage LibertyBell]